MRGPEPGARSPKPVPTHDEYTRNHSWTPVDEYEEAPMRVIPCVSDHLVSWSPEDEYEERARARNYRRESDTDPLASS